jgi:hypothetical protein
MSRNINWNELAEAYQMQPINYGNLLAVKGFRPATVKVLALVAERVYCEKSSGCKKLLSIREQKLSGGSWRIGQ